MNPIEQFGMAGQLGYAQYPGTLNQAPAADIFDRLRQCQAKFHSACQDFQRIAAERAAAEKELQAVSSEANQVINAALMDPTQPQQSACANPANGRY